MENAEQKPTPAISALEEKIETINVFRRLLDHELPTRSKNENVRNAITAEFREWVSDRINVLLGNGPDQKRSVDPLRDDEVMFVRILMRKASKGVAPQGPVPPVNRTKPAAPARPSGAPDALPVTAEETAAFNKNLASFLENMDRSGPEY